MLPPDEHNGNKWRIVAGGLRSECFSSFMVFIHYFSNFIYIRQLSFLVLSFVGFLSLLFVSLLLVQRRNLSQLSVILSACVISSCQSAATSEIVKDFGTRVWLTQAALCQLPDFHVYIYVKVFTSCRTAVHQLISRLCSCQPSNGWSGWSHGVFSVYRRSKYRRLLFLL